MSFRHLLIFILFTFLFLDQDLKRFFLPFFRFLNRIKEFFLPFFHFLNYMVRIRLATLGIFLIGWLIHRRVFQDRPPRPIPTEFSSYWQLFYIVALVATLITAISTIISLIQIYFRMEKKVLSNNQQTIVLFIVKILKLFDHYYTPHKILYEMILEKFGRPILENIFAFEKFCVTYYTENTPVFVVVFIELLPRFIVGIALFVDMFYFNQFYYLYRALILMLIVLAYRALRYVLTDFNEKFKKDCKKYFTYHGIINHKHKFDVHKDFLLKDNISPEMYENIVIHFITILKLELNLKKIDEWHNSTFPIRYFYYITRLFITLLFLSSWTKIVMSIFGITPYLKLLLSIFF